MKELDEDPKHRLEVVYKKQEQQQLKYEGSTFLQNGQNLYKFDMQTQTLERVELKSHVALVNGKAVTISPQVIVTPNTLYVAAINEKNAKRKILLKFGLRWDKQQKRMVSIHNPVARQIIIDPGPPKQEAEDKDPDAESDNKEPFEDEGAPDDDFIE